MSIDMVELQFRRNGGIHAKRSTCHSFCHQCITGMVSVPTGKGLRRVMHVFEVLEFFGAFVLTFIGNDVQGIGLITATVK